MKKNKAIKRILASSLSVAFTVSSAPIYVFAEDSTSTALTVTATDSKTTVTTVSEAEKLKEDIVTEKECDFEISVSGNGKILINNEEPANFKAESGEKALITAFVPEKEKDFYKFRCLKINGEKVEAVENEDGLFEYEYTVPEQLPEKITVEAEFKQIYTVNLAYSEAGEIVPIENEKPENCPEMGEVEVLKEEVTSLCAVPFENYCISGVFLDGKAVEPEKLEFDENGSLTFELSEENAENDIRIEFSAIEYSIEAEEAENGYIEIAKDYAESGKSAEVCIKPENGWYISRIYVNDVEVSVKRGNIEENFVVTDYKSGSFLIDKIKTDITVRAEFEEISNIPNISNPVVREDGSAETQEKHEFCDFYFIPPEMPEKNVAYGTEFLDVGINVTVPDDGEITEIKYWFDDEDPETKAVSIPTDGRKISFNAKEHSGENVFLHCSVTDSNGHTATKTYGMCINAIKPEILSVTGDGEVLPEALDGWYADERNITVVIKDKGYTMREDADAFLIDKNHTPLTKEQKEAMISWSIVGGNLVANICFNDDGEYRWSINYTNNAGNSNVPLDIETNNNEFAFAIHRYNEQEIKRYSISDGSSSWNDVLDVISFGLFKKKYTVKVNSPNSYNVKEIVYYKEVLNDKPLITKIEQNSKKKKEELEKLYKDGKFIASSNGIEVSGNEKAIVYARVTDKTGNVIYLGTDGLIADDKKPDPLIITIDKSQGHLLDNGMLVYNTPIPVHVELNENYLEGEAFSGIKCVSYYIAKNLTHVNNSDADKVLYDWDRVVDHNEFKDKLSFDFTIDPKEIYNMDGLSVRVEAYDNAGNEIRLSSDVFGFNLDKNSVSIQFDSTKPLNEKYFKARTAVVEIEVEEEGGRSKDETFDEESANKAILDYFKYSGDSETPIVISEWNHNKFSHTATVTFAGNGEYACGSEFKYVNQAGNGVSELSVMGGANDTFVIDSDAPRGKITIEDNSWEDLFDTVTFGIFKSLRGTDESLKAVIEGEDDTSPVAVDYYISHSDTPLESGDLDKLNENEWTQLYSENTANKNNVIEFKQDDKYVVYARVTDNAGNIKYLCSDGHIIDSRESDIELTALGFLEERNGNNGKTYVYNSSSKTADIRVNINESEKVNSGIKYIKYNLESSGGKDEYVLYSNEKDTPLFPKYSYQDVIKIDTAKYNFSDLKFTLTTEDNAGNVNSKSMYFDIDVTKPQVILEYLDDDSSSISNGNSGDVYFNRTRNVKVTIVERDEHFDEEAAFNSIKINAVDAKGNSVLSIPPNVKNWDNCGKWNTEYVEGDKDKTRHSITIPFKDDAKYELSVNYSDTVKNASAKAEVKGNLADPYKFTVDKNAPTGIIYMETAEGRVSNSTELFRDVKYSVLSKEWIKTWCNADDITSPIREISYFKSSDAEAYTAEKLDTVTAWKKFDEFKITPNEHTVVYAKIVDMAGNRTYISTSGIVADNAPPQEELVAPVISVTANNGSGGIYNGDVNIKLKVEDPVVNNSYSGLLEVKYEVLNMGVPTTNGEEVLYFFNNPTPDRSELQREWSAERIISASENNSNDVLVKIWAKDRAGNESYKELPLKIDVTPPELSMTYTEDKAEGSKEGYYRSKTANITIKERNFNSDDVIVNVTRNGSTYPVGLDWSYAGSTSSSSNGDDSLYSASLPFSEDGTYGFEVVYTDMAGNTGNTISDSGFTVDATVPVINVNYDNKTPSQSGYFTNGREINIDIDEENFSDTNVSITVQRTYDGVKSDVSTDTKWENSNGKHSTKLVLDKDGDYTFDMKFTDEAGNANDTLNFNDSESAQKFTIDTVDPELEMNVNGKKVTDTDLNGAYSGEVIPMIKYSDINLDEKNVKIELSGSKVSVKQSKFNNDEISFELTSTSGKKAKWNGKVEPVLSENGNVIGRKITMDDFPKEGEMKEFDDIYTLSASVSDKSGRKKQQTMTFSVNRHGSTYDMSSLDNLLGKYVREPIDVTIVEINPNKLKNQKVTIFRNEVSQVLNEGTDYTVECEGGNGKWYSYTYKIKRSNFETNGVYRISVFSTDAADNISENNLESKDNEVYFGIDNEAPKIIVANLESKKAYAESSKDIVFTVNDNIKVKEVILYIDGSNKPEYRWIGDELDNILNNDGEFHYLMAGNISKARSLKIVCNDEAGNSGSENITDFYITTNVGVRLLHNKVAVGGAIGGLVAIVGAIIAIFRKKRNS